MWVMGGIVLMDVVVPPIHSKMGSLPQNAIQIQGFIVALLMDFVDLRKNIVIATLVSIIDPLR